MAEILAMFGPDLATSVGIYQLCWLAVFVIVTGFWVLGNCQGDHSVIDGFYGFAFAAVAWVSFLLTGATSLYAGVLLLMVSMHGGRLGYYLTRRWLGYRKSGGGDKRYINFTTSPVLKNGYWWKSFFVVMHSQTVIIMVFGLPAYFGIMETADSSKGLNLLAAIGMLVFGIGTYYEWLADGQLQAFKQNPANKGRYLECGVWALSRHPNYFGNVTVWWGIYLFALAGNPALWWTIVGPALNTIMLTQVLGAAFQDRYMGVREDYRELMARSSKFLPRFKR